jgi:hypothetical protein
MRTHTSAPSGQLCQARARCAFHRGGDRVARPGEGDEERIAFGADLATAVLSERRAQQAPMVVEHVGVAVAQPPQQTRRTLDVGEQERDGAARKLRHDT